MRNDWAQVNTQLTVQRFIRSMANAGFEMNGESSETLGRIFRNALRPTRSKHDSVQLVPDRFVRNMVGEESGRNRWRPNLTLVCNVLGAGDREPVLLCAVSAFRGRRRLMDRMERGSTRDFVCIQAAGRGRPAANAPDLSPTDTSASAAHTRCRRVAQRTAGGSWWSPRPCSWRPWSG